jgi:hypothetical protein
MTPLVRTVHPYLRVGRQTTATLATSPSSITRRSQWRPSIRQQHHLIWPMVICMGQPEGDTGRLTILPPRCCLRMPQGTCGSISYYQGWCHILHQEDRGARQSFWLGSLGRSCEQTTTMSSWPRNSPSTALMKVYEITSPLLTCHTRMELCSTGPNRASYGSHADEGEGDVIVLN